MEPNQLYEAQLWLSLSLANLKPSFYLGILTLDISNDKQVCMLIKFNRKREMEFIQQKVLNSIYRKLTKLPQRCDSYCMSQLSSTLFYELKEYCQYQPSPTKA